MNSDELVPPPWMNKSFFESAIRHHEKDTMAEVKDFVITPKMGEHFASIMFRCVINYSSKFQRNGNISMIVKAMPHEVEFMKEMFDEALLFKNETAMYRKVHPEIQNVLKSAGGNSKMAPK